MEKKLFLHGSVFVQKSNNNENNNENYYFNGASDYSIEETSPFKKAVYEDGEGVFAICDGIGGEDVGRRASFDVIQGLKEWRRNYSEFENLDRVLDQFKDFIARVNDSIFKSSISSPKFSVTGATFAGLLMKNGRAVSVNIGDSRVYLLRDGVLKQLSIDHTEAERMVKQGVITREKAKKHIKRFVLSRYIGLSPLEGKVQVEHSQFMSIQEEDIFLLCSNSLVEALDDELIESILENGETSEQIARKLMDASNEKTEKQTNTVLLVLTVKNAKSEVAKISSFHIKDFLSRKIRHSKMNFKKAGVVFSVFITGTLLTTIAITMFTKPVKDQDAILQKVSEHVFPLSTDFNNKKEDTGKSLKSNLKDQRIEVDIEEAIQKENTTKNTPSLQDSLETKEQSFLPDLDNEEGDLGRIEEPLEFALDNEPASIQNPQDENPIAGIESFERDENPEIQENHGTEEPNEAKESNNKNDELSIEEQIKAFDRALMDLWKMNE
jgi:PPM family protein phosphatase